MSIAKTDTSIIMAMVLVLAAGLGFVHIRNQVATGYHAGEEDMLTHADGEYGIINILARDLSHKEMNELTGYSVRATANGRLSELELACFLERLHCELDRYGTALDGHLESVFVCDELYFVSPDGSEQAIGGMYWEKSVMISFPSRNGVCADIEHLFRLLHHELSSLLLQKPDFASLYHNGWPLLLPTVEYGLNGGALDVIKQMEERTLPDWNDYDSLRGSFISSYAGVSFEQDFNETAGFIMMNYPIFLGLEYSEDEPVVQKCLEIIARYKEAGIDLIPCAP